MDADKSPRYFTNGQSRHYVKHKIYCSSCSHYEIEVAHWDGTGFSIDVLCAHCGNVTNYRYDNPFDMNGWKKNG